MNDLSQCALEQAGIGELIRAGHPDYGLRLGAQDWIKEEAILMAELKTSTRNKLPESKFGLPGSRKYPMPDRVHAGQAKARATQMVDKGKLSPASAAKIRAKADRILGKD